MVRATHYEILELTTGISVAGSFAVVSNSQYAIEQIDILNPVKFLFIAMLKTRERYRNSKPINNSVEVRCYVIAFWARYNAGELGTRGSSAIWNLALKHCNAISISNTECVLVESYFDIVNESRSGLWKNSITKNNMTIECIRKIPR